MSRTDMAQGDHKKRGSVRGRARGTPLTQPGVWPSTSPPHHSHGPADVLGSMFCIPHGSWSEIMCWVPQPVVLSKLC